MVDSIVTLRAQFDQGNSMDMIELAGALKNAGLSEANKIAILGFDACLMNMLEVSYEMLPYAEFIIEWVITSIVYTLTVE
jgi:hypothetical protein